MRFRITHVLLVLLFAGGGIYLLVQKKVPPQPEALSEPPGISQVSLRDVRIARPGYVAPDSEEVWVTARLGSRRNGKVAFLVRLHDGKTLFEVRKAVPISWLNTKEVLFYNGESVDPLWVKILRRIGADFPRDYCTRFYRFNIETGKMKAICDVHTHTSMTAFTLSSDSRWGVGTWGPLYCFEVQLDPKAPKALHVDEKYVWAPAFIDNEKYIFVGETSVRSRKVGISGSQPISQPLLKEIRESVILRGTPSIRLCGRHGGKIYAVDHQASSEPDRLLVIDENTSLVREVTHLHPSRELPAFSPSGRRIVYQGHLFDETMDSVFYQEVEEGSKPVLLVKGDWGSMNESTPVFLDESTILYVNWGRELLTRSLENDNTALHWPLDLVPAPTE